MANISNIAGASNGAGAPEPAGSGPHNHHAALLHRVGVLKAELAKRNTKKKPGKKPTVKHAGEMTRAELKAELAKLHVHV